MSAPEPPEQRAAPTPQGAWYPDPLGRYELRYHNGLRWTADVATRGARTIDPYGIRPSPVAVAPTSAHGRNGLAVAAMVLGIVSVGIGWIPFVVVLGAVAAILAIVFGVVGLRRSAARGTGRGFAIAGVATGAVGVLVCVGGVALTVVTLRAFDEYVNPPPHQVTITDCAVDPDAGTVTATIEFTNTGDETSDFSIRVDVVRRGTDNLQRAQRVTIDDLAPAATETVVVEQRSRLDDVDCAIGEVNGPLPFGIEIDP